MSSQSGNVFKLLGPGYLSFRREVSVALATNKSVC